MGICASSLTAEEKALKKNDKEIARMIKEQEEVDQALVKLLLLGAGESGKSTIFKQMRILYGKGFDDESRTAMASVIISNLINGTITCLTASKSDGINLFDSLCAEAKEAAALVEAAVNHQEKVMSEELAGALGLLWKDETFQKIHDRRAEYQLFSSYEDYAKKCAKEYPAWGGQTAGGDWVPSVSDVTKARVRTSGIVEESYNIDGVDFRMYDVGGQRNERKKWIHCFDNVTALIFVGAISEYDQVLYEDKHQNRLIEAFDLFEEICNSKWFKDTSIILFLNKRDLFEEKYLQNKVPLNVTGLFPDAPECEPDYQVATDWIVSVFLGRRDENNKDKEIYHHITCATDSENVSTVFNACKDIILKGNLKGSGFLE